MQIARLSQKDTFDSHKIFNGAVAQWRALC